MQALEIMGNRDRESASILQLNGYAEAEVRRCHPARDDLADFVPEPLRTEGVVTAVRDALD